MGEKGNGGHVATGGARAVRQVATPSDIGMGGSHLGEGSPSGGGGSFLSDLAGGAGEKVTDVGGAVVGKAREHRDED